jgi:superfamily I DNA/RNA helicase/RecB family exonuclease
LGDSSVDVIKQVLDYPAAPLRVLGPPASGKTRLLIERFRVLREKDFDVYILTYTKDSYRRLTEAIVEKNSVQIGYDPVVQYSRLAGEIIVLSGERRPTLISGIEEQLLLESVIVEHWSALKSSLRSICRTERFVRDVLDVIHALLQNGIGQDDVTTLAESTTAGPEIEDILMLYAEFRRALSARNLTTHPGISWDAARLCKKGCPDHPITKAAVVLVEDFQDIDPGQFELLTAIAPPGGPVAINVFGDPIGSVFGHRGTQARFLLEEFPKRFTAETVYLNARCRDSNAEGRAMEALLAETLGRGANEHIPLRSDDFAGLPPVEPLDDTRVEKAFSLEIVGDELDEAYTVGARIERLLVSGRCRPSDIAVITNEKHRYAPILRSAFRQHGIPLDTGGAVTGVFEDFLYAWLSLLNAPDDALAVRSIVTSPLYAHLGKEVLGDGSTSTVGAGEDDDREALRKFASGLAAELRARDASEWMSLLVEKCLRPVCMSYHGETNDDSIFVGVSRLLESWDTYANALDRLGQRPDLRAFARLSGLFSPQTTAPRLLPGSVGLYSCRESKGLFFPVVFVIGCSDLLFPSASRRQSVIPVGKLENLITEVLPDRMTSIYPARAVAEALREQHHFLYIGLSRATRALHVTAPRNFGGNEYPAPCSILEDTIAANYLCSTLQNDRIPAQIRFARAWTTGGYDAAVVDDLTRVSPAGAVWNADKAKMVPVAVDRFPLSKSSIEMFLACPRQFFYRKLLGIPQDPTAPARLGTLLHEVMARLGKRFKTKAKFHTGATLDVIRRMIDDVVGEDTSVEASSFYDRSIRHYLKEMIGGILDVDATLEGSYTISGVEEPVPFSYQGCEFSGRVDRIEDHATGEKLIVDFKTGEIKKTGKTHRKYVLMALEDPKKADWQIPFYMWAVGVRNGCLPDAFRFMAAKAGEKPFAVTLYACLNEDNIPAAAKQTKYESYLLEGEIEQIMERAVTIAGEIFTPRPHFDRTVDDDPCGVCEFAELCQREKKWG